MIRGMEVPPGSRILDDGPRWSALPLFLAAMGYRVAAVDLAPFPIQGGGADFVLADLRRPPFRDESFDAATVISTLEHVGLGWYDPRRAAEDDIQLMAGPPGRPRPDAANLLAPPPRVPEGDRPH